MIAEHMAARMGRLTRVHTATAWEILQSGAPAQPGHWNGPIDEHFGTRVQLNPPTSVRS